MTKELVEKLVYLVLGFVFGTFVLGPVLVWLFV